MVVVALSAAPSVTPSAAAAAAFPLRPAPPHAGGAGLFSGTLAASLRNGYVVRAAADAPAAGSLWRAWLQFAPAGAASAASAPAFAAAAVELPSLGATGTPLQSSFGVATADDDATSSEPGLPAPGVSPGGHGVHGDGMWVAMLAAAFGAGSAQSGLEACKEGVLPAGNVHTAAAAIADAGAAAPPASPPASWPAPPSYAAARAPPSLQQSHAVLQPPAFLLGAHAPQPVWPPPPPHQQPSQQHAPACSAPCPLPACAVTAADPGMGAAICVQCAIRAVRSHAWQAGKVVVLRQALTACNEMHWKGFGGENAHSLAPLRPPYDRSRAFFGLVTSDVALRPGLGLAADPYNLHALLPCSVLHSASTTTMHTACGASALSATPARHARRVARRAASLPVRAAAADGAAAAEKVRARAASQRRYSMRLCSAAALAAACTDRRGCSNACPRSATRLACVRRDARLFYARPLPPGAPLTRRAALPTAPD